MLFASLAAGCLPACRSGQKSEPDAQPYHPPPEREPGSIGFFLTELDASLRAWTNYELGAKSDGDRRTQRAIEEDIAYRVRQRQAEVLDQLETGPAYNRAVAAVALGFTADPGVLGPILARLDDPEPEVVNNALLGIGLLGLPETPLEPVLRELRGSEDAWSRNNAAFALHRLAAAGRRDAALVEASREVLRDPEPGVRAQAASTLGIVSDPESIQGLGDLLHDETALVSAAAATALAEIGRDHPELRGRVARLLAASLDRVPAPSRRWLLRQLRRLSGRDFGEESEAWIEWAGKLPG